MNVAGTFRYLVSKKKKLSVYLQFKQVESGSEIAAIAVKAGGALIQVSGGKVLINGKETTVFPAAVGQGQLVKKGNALVLKGFSKRRIAFVSQVGGSYRVDVGVKAGKRNKFRGLISNLRHPFKYQVSAVKAKTLFVASVPFKRIVVGKRYNKARAEKCCAAVKVLDAKKFEQCVSDATASGKCYVKTYLKQNNKK